MDASHGSNQSQRLILIARNVYSKLSKRQNLATLDRHGLNSLSDAGTGSGTTIAFIAQQTGVSVPTVSKVINGRSDVAPETRRRVEAAIREHGYRRAGREQQVRQSSSSPSTNSTASGRWRSCAASRTSPGSITCRSCCRRCRAGALPAAVGSKASSRAGPLGVIAVFSDLSETMRSQLRTRGIPFVILDPTGEPQHDTPSVGATNWNGGLTATRHLLVLGHTA